ncbi:MAG: hypothetical protein NTX12_03740 [Actinobacteria bacterium]|nr:hypothetical protein [Actinomycetota bacterium]
MEFVKRFWRDQSGVVESGLVLIPLLALFLISIELIIAVNMRNIDLAVAQGRAASIAIGAEQGDGNGDSVTTFHFSHSQEKLQIVVTRQSRRIPDLLAGLASFIGLQNRRTEVTGVAVLESQP